jgi:methionine-S-sulfoxide reductase
MQQIKGVESVESGYSGGKLVNPTYKEVCSGLTGHAEAVKVKFDPELISFEELLKIFFATHNPTVLDPDDKRWSQYRSIILYHNDEQKQIAERVKQEIGTQLDKPVLTEIEPSKAFYKAEEYHQNYYQKDPAKAYCQNVIDPKLAELRKLLKAKLK